MTRLCVVDNTKEELEHSIDGGEEFQAKGSYGQTPMTWTLAFKKVALLTTWGLLVCLAKCLHATSSREAYGWKNTLCMLKSLVHTSG